MAKLCKFVSRSDLVLISFWILGFFIRSRLQACISFCSVSDKSGASLFLPCSHKNAVAHVVPRSQGDVSPTSTRFCGTCHSTNKINSSNPCCNSVWNECCMNEHQSHDSHRRATNAGSMRINFCVLERCDC